MLPADDFSVDVRPDRERLVLAPRGALDRFTAPELRSAVVEAVAAGWRAIVIDLRGLEFMDAGGVHLLEQLRDGLAADAHCSMIDGVDAVAFPLELLGHRRLLPLAEMDEDRSVGSTPEPVASSAGSVHQLLYTSVACQAVPDDELLTLFAGARATNAELGVTGLLLHSGGSFMQLLEGSIDAVRETYRRICVDVRHHQIRLLLERDVDQRAFSAWSMGFRHIDPADFEGLSGFLREPDADAPAPDLAEKLLRGFRAVT